MTAPQKYNFGISKTVLIRHACAKAGHSWTTALQPDDAVVPPAMFHQGGGEARWTTSVSQRPHPRLFPSPTQPCS